MKIFIFILCFLFVSYDKNCKALKAFNQTKIVESEERLTQMLFKKYNRNLRPADTVEIKFSLYLNQIITLIEQEQIIVLNVFLDHEWIDNRLMWDPEEFSNISLLRISSSLLWT